MRSMPVPEEGADSGRGELSPEDRAAFQRRLSELDQKLGKAEAARQPSVAERDAARDQRGMAYGLRMATELVAAVVFGGLIGYGLDMVLHTGPWLFLVFFFLGFAAGVLNVVRGYRQLQGDVAARTGGNIGKPLKDDDD
jgi:ATP synthase protein I